MHLLLIYMRHQEEGQVSSKGMNKFSWYGHFSRFNSVFETEPLIQVAGWFDGADTPVSGIIRRNNVDIAGSTLPAEVVTQGTSDSRHIQNISVSADFGRENILELGRFGPYYKYATFPFEVTSEFEVIATEGDLVNVSGSSENLTARSIVIKDTAGTVLDLGSKNKLTSVSYSGGDTAAMTVHTELNKLASNCALGRNMAGVHYRADGDYGLDLGEKIAIQYYMDYLARQTEPYGPITFTKFNGDTFTIPSGGGQTRAIGEPVQFERDI